MENTIFAEVASLFKTNEEQIKKESLKLFLTDKLKKLMIEQFNIARKYGVQSVEEMENFYKQKTLSEKDSFEDYFTLNHVESELVQIKNILTRF